MSSINDLGRVLTDQALAVPVEPASGLAPSGFDPSRAVERIGDWYLWYDPLPGEFRGEDWAFVHAQYRGEHHGDARCGRDESREMCLQTMDWHDSEDERENHEAEHGAPPPSDAFLKFTNVLLVKQLGQGLIAANSILACNGRGFADGVLRGQLSQAIRAFKDWSDARDD